MSQNTNTNKPKSESNIINAYEADKIARSTVPPHHIAISYKLDGFSASKILPKLYLSGSNVATNLEMLRKLKVTHILNATKQVENKFESDRNFVYKKIELDDSDTQDLLNYLEDAYNFIDEALKNEKNLVLVHCISGMSRSASIVIAYLMRKGVSNTYKEAYEYVLSCRSIIEPNENFQKQLIEYEKILKAQDKSNKILEN